MQSKRTLTATEQVNTYLFTVSGDGPVKKFRFDPFCHVRQVREQRRDDDRVNHDLPTRRMSEKKRLNDRGHTGDRVKSMESSALNSL